MSVLKASDAGSKKSTNLLVTGHKDKGRVNAFGFNPFHESLLATGSEDKTL